MKMPKLGLHFLRKGLVCATAIALFATSAQAGTIQIDFTGMNLKYNGSAIYDADSIGGGALNPADADPLSTVDFFIDGNLTGSLTSDLSLDAYIPDVLNIPSAVGTVNVQTTAGNPGYFDLLIGTGPVAAQHLALDLDEVSVTYVDFAGQIQFVFGAAVAASNAQNLPFGLQVGDPVTLSFSAQLDAGSKTTGGGFVTGFSATGTGQVRGEAVPEPSTVALLGMAAVAIPVYLRRRSRR
jgi:hypothetical protein